MVTPRRPGVGEPVRVLVLGVGHLGRHHARIYHEIEEARLVGLVDPDPTRARELAAQHGVPHHAKLTDALLDDVHAVSVVTPTPTHYEVARRCMERGVSVLVEKPMASTVEQARELRDLAIQSGVTLQVGHIERFNPVVLAALPYIVNPVFIECDRIHPFSFRSIETSVIFDLMIHDIDLVLQLVDAAVDRLDAAGARILSETEDLANCRLSFENGCIAVFKSSRVAIQKSRKMRIFCEDAYVSLDHVNRTGMRVSMREGFDRSKVDFREMAKLEEAQGMLPIFTQFLKIDQIEIPAEEPLKNELRAFCKAVSQRTEPVVTGDHGLRAIEVASRIENAIRSSQAEFIRKRDEYRRRRHD
jgi:predicted dehydrogenase